MYLTSYFTKKAAQFNNDKPARPLQAVAGYLAALGLAGGVSFLVDDSKATYTEGLWVEKIHLEYSACTADRIPVALGSDVAVTVARSDLKNIDKNSEEITSEMTGIYKDFVSSAINEGLGRIDSFTIPVRGSTPAFKKIMRYNEIGAEAAVVLAYKNQNIATFDVVVTSSQWRPRNQDNGDAPFECKDNAPEQDI